MSLKRDEHSRLICEVKGGKGGRGVERIGVVLIYQWLESDECFNISSPGKKESENRFWINVCICLPVWLAVHFFDYGAGG